MRDKKFARISMTLPADLLREADREAERLDRSRSWIIAEALRRYFGQVAKRPADTPTAKPPAPSTKSRQPKAADLPHPKSFAPAPELLEICRSLNQEGAEYLVVRQSPGIELLIGRTWENAARVLVGLAGAGYEGASEWLPEAVLGQPATQIVGEPAVRLLTISRGLRYEELEDRGAAMEIEGVSFRMAHPD